MPDLYEVALAFRGAIEEAVRCGELSEMSTFPRGCCGYASDLLQRYFFEHKIFTWYMSGQYGYGWNGVNHAWLETQDGTVIDITGDQFVDKTPRFSAPVYVGVRKNGFHDKFILDRPIGYQFSNHPLEKDVKLDKRYETVLRHMNVE